MTDGPESPHDALVRRFAAARDRGDATLAADLWEQLLVLHKDRVRTWVATWRHPSTGQRIAGDDYDDVAQAALVKALKNMVTTFRGSTRAEFIAALRTCTGYAASDHWRRTLRDERRHAGSLDETWTAADGDGAPSHGRFDGRLAAAGFAEAERDGVRAETTRRIRDAIGQIANEKQRRVVELDLDGVPDEEIAAQLDISVTYVYKLRERGRTRIREVIEDDEG